MVLQYTCTCTCMMQDLARLHLVSIVPFLLLCVAFLDYLLSGVTKALKRMNRSLNMPQLQKIMMEFERESEIMDLKEELISDTIDDAMGEEDDEEVGGINPLVGGINPLPTKVANMQLLDQLYFVLYVWVCGGSRMDV